MASRCVNKVILIGHLGKDAETKLTPSGAAVTKFPIATNRRWKDQQAGEWKEETDWANVVLWRQENVANYLLKGKQVYVEGRLQTRNYDDKDGKKQYFTEVVAEEVILLGGRGGDGGEGAGPVSMPRTAQRPQPAETRRSRASRTTTFRFEVRAGRGVAVVGCDDHAGLVGCWWRRWCPPGRAPIPRRGRSELSSQTSVSPCRYPLPPIRLLTWAVGECRFIRGAEWGGTLWLTRFRDQDCS